MGIAELNQENAVHTTVILATSADGKIADYQRSPARFPSAQDRAYLEAAIAPVDAVIFGAGTLRAYGTSVVIHAPELICQRQQRGQSEQPLQIVCSRSGKLSQGWRFFRQPFERGLVTTPTGKAAWGDRAGFRHIWTLSSAHSWAEWLTQLQTAGYTRLALLGGGNLVAQWLAADLVDELKLTVCPLLVGGKTSPTPVDGQGWWAADAPRLRLIDCRAIADEVFLHYQVQRPLHPLQN